MKKSKKEQEEFQKGYHLGMKVGREQLLAEIFNVLGLPNLIEEFVDSHEMRFHNDDD